MDNEGSVSEEPSGDPLFKNIKYYVAGDVPDKVLEVLQTGGAEKLYYVSDFVTHMICGKNPNEDDLSSARDLYEIPAVRWQWVVVSSKLKKLVDTHGFVVSEESLFYNMTFSLSQVTSHDRVLIWGIITSNGGIVRLDFDSKCTHLISTKASGEKYEKALQISSIKVITPDWLIETMKNKSLASYESFHPQLLIVPSPVKVTPTEKLAGPITQITGFETTDTSGASNQSNQVLLDQLKQRMPWNQATETPMPAPPATPPRPQLKNFQQPSPMLPAALTPQNQIKNVSQQTPISNVNQINQPRLTNPPQTSQPTRPNVTMNQHLVNFSIANSINQNSFRSQLPPNQSNHSLATNQLNQQHIQAGMQRQHLLQNSLTQQQNQAPILEANQKGNFVQIPSDNFVNKTQMIDQKIVNNMNQMQINQMNQESHLQQNQIQPGQMPNQTEQIQSLQQEMQQMQQGQLQQMQQMQTNQIKSPMLMQNRQTPQSTQQIQPGQIQLNQQLQSGQVARGQQVLVQQMPQAAVPQLQLQNQNMQQMINSGMQMQGNINQGQVGQPALANQGVGLQRLPNPQLQRQQLITQQAVLNTKQLPNQQANLATNEAMLKQQRLLQQQQQQQLRMQQMQNAQNSQYVTQQGTLINRQGVIPAGAVKQPGQPQFVQGPQVRPVGWQQQPQPQPQQVVGQGMPVGAIQRPPNWAPGQPGAGVMPQRQLIQLDAQTNAHLQQMDPQQRAAFVQKLQRQRHLLVQQFQRQQQEQQQLQQQQQQQRPPQPQQQQPQFVIRGQLVIGQPPPNGQWQQGGPRPQALVVQPSPAVGPNSAPAIRLPQKAEEPQTEPQSPLVVNPKTKTALANMLSIRKVQSGGPPVDSGTVTEPSAAGTLRLMTAQHNAALQQQQRRTLNNGAAVQSPSVVPPQIRAPQQVVQQTPTPPVQVPPRPLLYGHNPNLKLPPNLFLLGCVFHVVEIENVLNEECPSWQNAIRKRGGEIENVYCGRVTHVLCKSQKHGVVMQALRDTKRCVTAYWLNDVFNRKQVAPPWLATHLPVLYPDEAPGARHMISASGFDKDDVNQIKIMAGIIGARYTCYLSKHNTALICAKLDGEKYNYARKYGIPILNVQWLSDILMGNLTALNQVEHARYQQFNVPNPFAIDYNLNPVLMHGWKMPINITQESYERVKRNAPPPTPPKVKKPKVEPSITSIQTDGAEPRVLFSQVSNTDQYYALISRLGGSLASSAKTATHLIMPKLVRSYKLLQCIAKGTRIVPESWLMESDTANKFVTETHHTFTNIEEFNQMFHCDFNSLLLRKDRDKLFENRLFYLTPSVYPPRPILKTIIELAGGTVEDNRRSLTQIEEINSVRPQSYLILTQKDDLHLISDCIVDVKSEKKCIVFNTELVLSSILRDEILFNDQSLQVVIYT